MAVVLTGMLVTGFVAGGVHGISAESFGLIVGTIIGAEYRGTSVLGAGGKRTTPAGRGTGKEE